MLLSRVAESLYWINRYLERAENISRFVEVSESMSLDCPPGSAETWLPLVDASGDRNKFDESYENRTPSDVINFLSMSNSVSVRSPLLDKNLLRFINNKLSDKFKYGYDRYLLRQILKCNKLKLSPKVKGRIDIVNVESSTSLK